MIYLLVFFLYFYILQDHHLEFGVTECKCKSSIQPPINLSVLPYSTSCYFQITERFMNWSSKCENRRHNKTLNLKTTKAYQIITNKKNMSVQLFFIVMSNVLIYVTIFYSKWQRNDSFRVIIVVLITLLSYFLHELLFSCQHE